MTNAQQLSCMSSLPRWESILACPLFFTAVVYWGGPSEGQKYCQLIRDSNKFERFQWAVEQLPEGLQ